MIEFKVQPSKLHDNWIVSVDYGSIGLGHVGFFDSEAEALDFIAASSVVVKAEPTVDLTDEEWIEYFTDYPGDRVTARGGYPPMVERIGERSTTQASPRRLRLDELAERDVVS